MDDLLELDGEITKKLSDKLQGMSQKEIELILKQLERPEVKVNDYNHFYGERHTKIIVITDTHIGSKYYREDMMNDLLKVIKKEKPEAVYHAGDIIEGMSDRPGHIYELSHIGTTQQVKKAAEQLGQIRIPFFFTTGNHDEWSKVKANQGHLVGEELESKIKGSKFLGEMTANIKFSPEITMRLTHEGMNAYALSYPGQKRVNALEGGTKPEIIVNGHIHKFLYMYYRNIHYFEGGTFQDQTPFMAMKGTPAMKGYWMLDIYFNKSGVTKLRQTAYPYY
jgi:UDP-2,3-diacylglucosamine pyrophosphatase LpxH